MEIEREKSDRIQDVRQSSLTLRGALIVHFVVLSVGFLCGIFGVCMWFVVVDMVLRQFRPGEGSAATASASIAPCTHSY